MLLRIQSLYTNYLQYKKKNNYKKKLIIKNLVHGEVYSIQHYVIKFVSDLRQVGGFLLVLRFPPPITNDRHDITEILLKVALNTINLT